VVKYSQEGTCYSSSYSGYEEIKSVGRKTLPAVCGIYTAIDFEQYATKKCGKRSGDIPIKNFPMC